MCEQFSVGTPHIIPVYSGQIVEVFRNDSGKRVMQSIRGSWRLDEDGVRKGSGGAFFAYGKASGKSVTDFGRGEQRFVFVETEVELAPSRVQSGRAACGLIR